MNENELSDNILTNESDRQRQTWQPSEIMP